MPKTRHLAILLCCIGCSTKAPEATNKLSDSPVSDESNATPTGGESAVVPSPEATSAEPEAVVWKPFTPPSGHYSVLLPDAAQTLPSNRPTIKNHGLSLANGRIYMVSASPQSRFDDPDEIAEALAAARDAHLGDKQALFDEEVSLGDETGRTYAFVNGDDVWEARIFLKGDTLYQLYAVVPKATYVQGDPDVARFLDSFRILAPQDHVDEVKP